MTKRKKTVFHADELFHVFISQSQNEGKTALKQANGWHEAPSDSYRQAYFEGKKIWSYGSHYLMAQLYNDDSILLINSEESSHTTNKHKWSLYQSASHKIAVFVPYPGDPKNIFNLSHLNDLIAEKFNKFVMCRAQSGYSFKELREAVNKYNAFCNAFKIKKTVLMNDEFLELVNELIEYKEHFHAITEQKKAIKYAEKREVNRLASIEREKREAKEHIKKLVRAKNWIKGKGNSFPSFSYSFYGYGEQNRINKKVFLRIVGDTVETSKHATVPLDRAIKLYRMILAKQKIENTRIGHYSVTQLSEDNKNIIIGCHEIELSEVERVLGHLV